ncbi:MAG: hypothetical protein H6557_30930 [Lewinellaceae bacterium]|nr:hypothetical protein [Phaeodactylibacter sp.]MCB9041065.1 hypothetical protein [Lewinellaceae bacterium]
MKKKTTAENVLKAQTLMAYALMIGILVLCIFQMPKITAFLQEYGEMMKAAFPVR